MMMVVVMVVLLNLRKRFHVPGQQQDSFPKPLLFYRSSGPKCRRAAQLLRRLQLAIQEHLPTQPMVVVVVLLLLTVSPVVLMAATIMGQQQRC